VKLRPNPIANTILLLGELDRVWLINCMLTCFSSNVNSICDLTYLYIIKILHSKTLKWIEKHKAGNSGYNIITRTRQH